MVIKLTNFGCCAEFAIISVCLRLTRRVTMREYCSAGGRERKRALGREGVV